MATIWQPDGPEQKPKPVRACDLCRKKKIRCDGTTMPDYKCTKCKSYGLECTYDIVSKRPPTKSYVESLEDRLQKMEELIGRLQSQVRLGSSSDSSALSSIPGTHIPNLEHSTSPPTTPLAPPVFSPVTPSDDPDPDASDDEMEASRKLLNLDFHRLSLRDKATAMPYLGKSSSLMLVHSAVDMKLQYTGIDTPQIPPFGSTGDGTEQRVYTFISLEDDLPPQTNFPPPDLMEALINAYFATFSVYIPLLHRPTFEQGIADGLHLRDPGFGAVVLLVCANGARWIEPYEPRLSEYGSKAKPGWVWFMQVEKARKSPFAPPRLYDLQRYVLMAIYIGGYSHPHNTWTIVGLGIRVAQDIGIHRKKTYSLLSKVEGELWKRAFWCLISFDRNTSFLLGRPCCLQDEDFDVDPVEECDDEYWVTDDPDAAFKQPPGKPSKMSFINCLNRLTQILAFASRTIYSINKSKTLMGFVGEEWEERIVAELDSALNKWIDTVPDHLRWDPHREDTTLLNQSAALYCKYYQTQIFVHRPFLPSLRKSSRLSLTSLAICTNAARSCVHVSDVQCKRTGKPSPFNRLPIFTAGIVLLVNLWAGKRSGYSNQSTVSEVQKCMNMLKLLESDYRIVQRLWGILNVLYSAGDFNVPEPEMGRKRGRDVDDPTQSHAFQTAQDTSEISPGGTGTTHKKQHLIDPQAELPTSNRTSLAPWPMDSTASSPESFDLPVHTEDLGRVPFHHGFSPFLNPAQGFNAQQQAILGAATAPGGLSTQQVPQGLPHVDMSLNGMGEAPYFDPAFFGNPYVETQTVQQTSSDSPGSAIQFSQQAPQAEGVQPAQSPSAAGDCGDLGTSLPPLTQEDLALADDTLELWSAAPISMSDWGDWGAFINNVSGVPPPSAVEGLDELAPVL
ncbi:fungal-specific transcription factor domain-containing protein [Trametes maxima]|nr:fungal-specific transcription factor domain-containing protein [Trametes maxima]